LFDIFIIYERVSNCFSSEMHIRKHSLSCTQHNQYTEMCMVNGKPTLNETGSVADCIWE